MTGLLDDDRLDAMGHRAAAQLRAEARSIADSPAALRRLLADVATSERSGAQAEPATVVPLRTPHAANRRHQLAVAAVIAVFVAGIGYALVNGVRGSIDIVAPSGTGNGPGLGGTTPGSTTPGSTTPGSTPVGGTTPGSTTPGSTTPGSTTPGSTTPGSTTPGTTHPTAVDPIDAFAAIAAATVTLDTVPRLLPGDAFDPASTDRIEYELPSETFRLQQTWVRAGADGVVDAVVTATTERDHARLGSPIAIDGWPAATRNETDDGSILVNLNSDAGTVQLSATGLDLDDVVAIAASLTVDDATQSWRSDLLAPPAWTAFDQGWRAGAAVRTLVASGDDDIAHTELTTSVGVSIVDLGLPFAPGTGRLVEVAGRQAIAASGAGAESLVLLDPNGTALTVATRDAPDSPAELVASLTEVDQATWDASSSPGAYDGCSGVIC